MLRSEWERANETKENGEQSETFTNGIGSASMLADTRNWRREAAERESKHCATVLPMQMANGIEHCLN